MKHSTLTSVALLGASALADSIGSAVVLNSCPYDVYVCNTPAAGEGYDEYKDVLQPGQTFSQVYTKLTSSEGKHDGWAIKLSKSEAVANIFQYEYTFQDDGLVWFDLSAVDGNPWNGEWNISSNGQTCQPSIRWYRDSTDNEYGMQPSCSDDAAVTVTLCAGTVQSTTAASSIPSSTPAASPTASPTASPIASSSAPAVSIPAYSQATSYVAATSAAWTPSPDHQHGRPPVQANYAEVSTTVVTSPTTFATSTTAAVEKAPGVTIYEFETAIVTDVVTAVYTAPSRLRRHEHHGDHHQHAI